MRVLGAAVLLLLRMGVEVGRLPGAMAGGGTSSLLSLL